MALVVIGGVAAGLSAAARARRLDPHLEIVVLEKGPVISYGACGLPYFVEGRVRGSQPADRLHSRILPQGAQDRRADRRARGRDLPSAPRGGAGIGRAGALRPPGDRHRRALRHLGNCRGYPAPRLHPAHARRRRADAPLPRRKAAAARRGGGRRVHRSGSRRRAPPQRPARDRAGAVRSMPCCATMRGSPRPCASNWKSTAWNCAAA